MPTANAAIYVGVTAEGSGTWYPTMSSQNTTGNSILGVSSVFNVNAATGNVTAPGFVGTLWGQAGITGGNIQGATTINVTTANITAPGFSGTLWGQLGITGGNISGATTINTTANVNASSVVASNSVYAAGYNWANGVPFSSGTGSTNQIAQGASNVTVNSATSTVAVGISSSNVVVFAANGVTTTSNIYAQNSIGVQNSSGVSLFHIAYNSALGSIDTFFG